MFKRNWRVLFTLVAISIDTLAIALTGVSAYFLREILPSVPTFHPAVFVRLTCLIASILLLVALVLGLYRASFRTSLTHQYRLAWKTFFISIPTTLSLLYLLSWHDFPRRFIILFFALLPLWFHLGRLCLNKLNILLQQMGYTLRKAAVYGYHEGWREIIERFHMFPELGYELKGIVVREPLVKEKEYFQLNGRMIPIYPSTKLPWLVEQENVESIFISSPDIVTNGSTALLELCKRAKIKLKVLSPQADHLLGFAHVHDIAGITLYAPQRSRVESVRKVIKRIFDLIVASILIVLFLPVFALTALAVWIESGRPILYKQRRSALKGGKSFDFYKFRSMVTNADSLKVQLLAQNESDGALFKLKNDPRTTRVGRFIRRYSIDELPQLFNVLKGDMSLVGPRPLPIEDFDRVNEHPEFWETISQRGWVKPGITGLWQISGRSDIGFKEMVLLDCYYVENQSILFDLEILLETVSVVLLNKGAY